MKTILFFLIVLTAYSCMNLKDAKNYIRTTGQVQITHVQIPDTVSNMDTVQISAAAQAPNLCWSNIYFQLSKNIEFDNEYCLQAFGTYESYGSCPTGMVYGDTIISFQPQKTGIYIFFTDKNQQETEIDTLIVK